MYNHEMLKEIEKVTQSEERASKVLKGIHQATKLDFNKPFKVYKVTEPFTTNKLVKLYWEKNSSMFVFIRGTYRRDELNVIKVMQGGNFKIDGFSGVTAREVDTYCRKSDFHDDRKVCSESNVAFVFVIPETSLVPKKDYTFSESGWRNSISNWDTDERMLLDRFKITECYSYSANVRVIGQSSNKYQADKYSNGRTISLSSDKFMYNEQSTDVIDKSGYFRIVKQNTLRIKAKDVRNNRNKAELERFVKSGEHKEYLNRLEEVQKEIRNKVILKLSSIQTFDYDKNYVINTLTNLLRNLGYSCTNKFDCIVERFKTKQQFIDDVQSEINGLIKTYHNYTGNQSALNGLSINNAEKLHTDCMTSSLYNLMSDKFYSKIAEEEKATY